MIMQPRYQQAQQAPQPAPMPMPQPYGQPARNIYAEPYAAAGQSSNLIQWQLDPEDVITNLEHTLLGHRRNPDTLEWEGQACEALCNDKGVRALMSVVRMHLNKVVELSNLNEIDVKRMAAESRNAYVKLIGFNRKEYEIDASHRDAILTLLDHVTYASLRRAYLEGERKFLKTAERHIETMTHAVQSKPQGRGLFGLFGGS